MMIMYFSACNSRLLESLPRLLPLKRNVNVAKLKFPRLSHDGGAGAGRAGGVAGGGAGGARGVRLRLRARRRGPVRARGHVQPAQLRVRVRGHDLGAGAGGVPGTDRSAGKDTPNFE